MSTRLRQGPSKPRAIRAHDQTALDGDSIVPARDIARWFPQPISAVIADLQRVAADLESRYRDCGSETAALHDARHAISRAIFAAQELSATADRPNYTEQWIG